MYEFHDTVDWGRIMGIIYWQEEAQAFRTATSMQAIALNTGLWEAYVSVGKKGREIFAQCARDEIDWSLDTVLAYATFEDTPPSKPAKTEPVASSSSSVYVPARGNDENTKVDAFVKWMKDVAAAVGQGSPLSYAYGDRRVLRDGTVAVSVSVCRGSSFLSRVSFVFHYHPGTKGAQVGSPEGSKWHFKPFDGADKRVRVADYQFGHLDQAMVRKVKDIARKR